MFVDTGLCPDLITLKFAVLICVAVMSVVSFILNTNLAYAAFAGVVIVPDVAL